MEQPNPRRLPSRGCMLYFALRDEWVLKQFNTNYDFFRHFKETLNAFPPETIKREIASRPDTTQQQGPAGKARARIKHPTTKAPPA